MKRHVFIPALTVIATTLALSGCSAASSHATGGHAAGPIRVVASTNVWGDIARSVGGSGVVVTSIIDDPNKDPHEYQASGQNQLALSKAEVVVENGGGYDDFVDEMLHALSSKPVVVDATSVSGYQQHPSGGEFNEHLWYDFATVDKVAHRLADAFSTARPADAAKFAANAQRFEASVAELSGTGAQLKKEYAGEGVAITEPVPLYMLDAIGLVDKTPLKFSEAVENDTDVAPAVLRETLALFSNHEVALLAYNEQTTGAQTQQVLDAAKAHDVPVVAVTETLPSGTDYIGWMRGNLARIATALKDAR